MENFAYKDILEGVRYVGCNKNHLRTALKELGYERFPRKGIADYEKMYDLVSRTVDVGEREVVEKDSNLVNLEKKIQNNSTVCTHCGGAMMQKEPSNIECMKCGQSVGIRNSSEKNEIDLKDSVITGIGGVIIGGSIVYLAWLMRNEMPFLASGWIGMGVAYAGIHEMVKNFYNTSAARNK